MTCYMCDLYVDECDLDKCVNARSGTYHRICFDIAVTAFGEELKALCKRHGFPMKIDRAFIEDALMKQAIKIVLKPPFS